MRGAIEWVNWKFIDTFRIVYNYRKCSCIRR